MPQAVLCDLLILLPLVHDEPGDAGDGRDVFAVDVLLLEEIWDYFLVD